MFCISTGEMMNIDEFKVCGSVHLQSLE